MKKAGVRFSEEVFVSFEYNEDTKNVNILVVEGNKRYTGDVTVAEATKKTSNKK